MHDGPLKDLLNLMKPSVNLVQDRFGLIDTPDDFCTSAEGATLLDAIAMRLQVIGESVKQIYKNEFLSDRSLQITGGASNENRLAK